MPRRRGFTLIESLAVIAIIGILASIVTVSVFAAQRQARDTRRKSDLTAISFGFEARFNDRTCSDGTEYPHYNQSRVDVGMVTPWDTVVTLVTPAISDDCKNLYNYLKTIPADKELDTPYRFNLSSNKQHFRIGAKLEHDPQLQAELDRQSNIWVGSDYSGKSYAGAMNVRGTIKYNYFIGR